MMTESRRTLRILAFKVLYSLFFTWGSSAKGTPKESDEMNVTLSAKEAEQGLTNYLTHLASNEEKAIEQLDYAKTLIEGVLTEKEALLKKLSQHSAHWSIARMASADRVILLIACYEMEFLKLEPKIAINEAIELSKIFCAADAKSFINGILDAVARNPVP